MNYAERLAALTATRTQKTARQDELMALADKEGRTLDAAESEEFDTLDGEVKSIDKDIARAKSMQERAVASATPVAGDTTKSATASRVGVTVKNTQKLEPGIGFARFAKCIAIAKGNLMQAEQIAANQYADDEALNLRMKAAVVAGTTTGTTWASPLVRADNFEGDFVDFLRPATILGKFGTGNVPSLRRIPFNVRIVGQTSGGAGYWVGEGQPKPLTAFDFNAVELRFAKVANIAVLTEELLRFSSPSADRLVRDALADALIARVDQDFIDPAKAAVANVSPASITNGVTAITSSGPTADNIRNDLLRLWQPFIANNISPMNAVYIMHPSVALALSLMRNAVTDTPTFQGITMNGGTLEGVPVIVSAYVPYTSAGSTVILVNASDIWLADDGQVTVDASREASLQMDNAPTNNVTTPTATSMVSMWQTNSVALRAEWYVNYQKRRAQAVGVLTGVNWGE